MGFSVRPDVLHRYHLLSVLPPESYLRPMGTIEDGDILLMRV